MNSPTVKERPYSRKEVVDIIQSVMTSMTKGNEAEEKLHQQLSTISTYIQGMRAELAQMRSIEISHTHIPSATDELDAVVEETAKATGAIMDSCEKIEKLATQLPGDGASEVTESITRIYEACGFQDITGQRITKVVKALKNIESKVSEILEAFGHTHPTKGPAVKVEEKPGLLNGPQLNGPSVSQDEIDKLLASFDK